MKLTRRSFFGALMAAPLVPAIPEVKHEWKEYSVPIKYSYVTMGGITRVTSGYIEDLQDDLTRVTLEYIHKREQDLIRSMWGTK